MRLGRTVPSASSALPKPAPGHPNRSASLSTGSAGGRSSADSPTSTTPPDRPHCGNSGQHAESYFRAPQGRAHGQPCPGFARRRILRGHGEAGQRGAHGDDRLGATGRDLLVLTRAQVSAGGNDDAIATIRQALADAGCLVSGGPGCWPCWRCSSGPASEATSGCPNRSGSRSPVTTCLRRRPRRRPARRRPLRDSPGPGSRGQPALSRTPRS